MPRWRAREAKRNVVTTRWIHISKGDVRNPNYIANLVGRKLKMDKRLDLFAATPPLESFGTHVFIVSKQSKEEGPREDPQHCNKASVLYAPAARPVFIEILMEDSEVGDLDRVGKLNVSFYGIRDAVQNWA